jgi:tRNA dimethylallyltransferase
MAELKSGTKGLSDIYDIKIFGLSRPREEIYAAIDERVDRMFGSGLVREVKKLKMNEMSKTAKAVLGFKEAAAYINGECDLAAAKSAIKMNTRRFAKRQLTWFGRDARIKWFDLSKTNQAETVRNILRQIGR